MTAQSSLFYVAYQTGGTENFKWQEVWTPFTQEADAWSKVCEIERAGYPAVVLKKGEPLPAKYVDWQSERPR